MKPISGRMGFIIWRTNMSMNLQHPLASGLRNRPLCRKPFNLEQVLEKRSCHIVLSSAEREALGEPWEFDSIGKFDDLPECLTGTLFLMKVNGIEYLVNTEGYNYCRYIGMVIK
jgi:hypothetical protein